MPNNENSVGPVVATIVILAVIVLGGLYFWGHRSSNSMPTNSAAVEGVTPGSSMTTPAMPVSTSTYDANSPMSGS